VNSGSINTYREFPRDSWPCSEAVSAGSTSLLNGSSHFCHDHAYSKTKVMPRISSSVTGRRMHVNAEKTMFATDAFQSKWILVESVSAPDLEKLSSHKCIWLNP
jgi:hypothetical protein